MRGMAALGSVPVFVTPLDGPRLRTGNRVVLVNERVGVARVVRFAASLVNALSAKYMTVILPASLPVVRQ